MIATRGMGNTNGGWWGLNPASVLTIHLGQLCLPSVFYRLYFYSILTVYIYRPSGSFSTKMPEQSPSEHAHLALQFRCASCFLTVIATTSQEHHPHLTSSADESRTRVKSTNPTVH